MAPEGRAAGVLADAPEAKKKRKGQLVTCDEDSLTIRGGLGWSTHCAILWSGRSGSG